MQTFYDISTFIFSVLNKYLKLLLITALWAVCCIPIVTLGASTAALNYVADKIVKECDEKLIQGFFVAFRSNLKKGIALTAVYIVLFTFLCVDFVICFRLPKTVAPSLLAFVVVLGMMFGMMCNTTFALLARYENKTFEYLKNSFFISFLKFGYILVCFCLTITPVVTLVFFTKYFIANLPTWVLVVMPVTLWVNTTLFNKAFSTLQFNQLS